LWFEVVKLPGALTLEGVVLGLVPIDSAIIEIIALNPISWAVEWHKLYGATYDATFEVVDVLGRNVVQSVSEHNDVHRALLLESVARTLDTLQDTV
jgi:hypothetical protein